MVRACDVFFSVAVGFCLALDMVPFVGLLLNPLFLAAFYERIGFLRIVLASMFITSVAYLTNLQALMGLWSFLIGSLCQIISAWASLFVVTFAFGIVPLVLSAFVVALHLFLKSFFKKLHAHVCVVT